MLLQHYCVIDFIFHFSLFWESILRPRPRGRDWGVTLHHEKKQCGSLESHRMELVPTCQAPASLVTLNFIWTSENVGLIYISLCAGNSLGTMQGGFRMNVLWVTLQFLVLWAHTFWSICILWSTFMESCPQPLSVLTPLPHPTLPRPSTSLPTYYNPTTDLT